MMVYIECLCTQLARLAFILKGALAFYKSRRGLVTTKFKDYIHIISGGQGLTCTTCELDSFPLLRGESMSACH